MKLRSALPTGARSEERSLVRQAVLGIVFAELICLIGLAAVSIAHERRVRLRALDVVLEGRADSLFGAIQDAEDPGDNVRVDPREIRVPRGDVYAVYDQGGRRLGASQDAPEPLLAADGLHGRELWTRRWEGHSFRVIRRSNLRIIDRAETGGAGLERPVTIVYAVSLDHIWREVFEGIEFYLGASLLLTLGTTVFMVVLMRRVLQPIEALAAAATAVSPRELRFQAPPQALSTSELRPLALALTAMIEELRQAFERQHRFLGDAAHELKTAVAVVRSSLQLMLLRRRSTEAYEEGLRAVVADNTRAEELIARMLLMARLEEPGGVPHKDEADLESVVRTCLRKLEPLAKQACLHFERRGPQRSDFRSDLVGEAGTPETGGAPMMVPVSAGDLEVLVSNLVVNAIEHSAPGAPITIELAREDGGAVLRVTDHGEGIPEDAQEHIFERFFRVDRSRTRGTGGAGLGLSITKAIVDQAGGKIAVASRFGEGTTITVGLPFALPLERSAKL